MTQPCPRQVREAVLEVQRQHKSHWREDGTCSYCGSISPDALFAAIESGCKITPTDKSYKIYVDLPEPHPDALCVVSVANFDRSGEPGWKRVGDLSEEERATLYASGWSKKEDDDWVQFGPRGPTIHAKFYFQHLSPDEQQRFVDLYNAKKITLAHPGHFYVLPFFMRLEP